MNLKKIINILAHILQLLSSLLVLPLITSVIYGEKDYIYFLATAAVSFAIGTALRIFVKPDTHVIYAKEGFIIVSLSWITLSLFGALPFCISGAIPNYIDAFFETVSGFTTTGASILTNVEALGKGMLLWRSFTHWIGGMGILVFILAIIPNLSDRSIHIMRAEMPGPVIDKIVPRAKETAKILYLLYIGLTVLEVIFLLFGGMSFYEAVVYSFGTAGTGGFALTSEGLAPYSPYLQWVIAVFMMLFGINFNLYYLLIIRRSKAAFKSLELWVYLILVVLSTTVIAININSITGSTSKAVRDSFFQVTSIVSTTGYSTADFNLWPTLSKSIILTLMITGACAGSTAGGLKLSRAVMLAKISSKEIKHLLHPRSVSVVKLDGKTLDDDVCHGVLTYFAIYCFCIVAIFFLLSFEHLDIETNLSATISCFNNIGPGLSKVGPASSYACYSLFSKALLSFAMLMGRLEIFPVLLLFAPSTWSKH